MNRIEFMQKLESLLTDISDSEREEALQYYNDYLNDAGVENEEEVLASLGSPEKIARVIKEGLENPAEGEFTENGYKDYYSYEEKKNEVVKKRGSKRSPGMTALLIILCILASPLLIAIGAGIFGTGVGIFGGIIGLFVGVAAAGIALLAASVLLIGVGIGSMFTIPVAGLCLIGMGLLLLGLSLFCIWITVWICGTALPFIVRKAVDFFSRLFSKKGGPV